jgi:putative ATP-binding cassette transporter
VIYAATTSALTYFIGHPLVQRVSRKNESEAQLRYELTRVRENAESIALIGGKGVVGTQRCRSWLSCK